MSEPDGRSTEHIEPRWEWRTFGDVTAAERRLATEQEDRVVESDETYLLSRSSDESVKIRDGVLDVKRLQRVNEQGAELWRPVLKAGFPLSHADVREAFDALAVATPSLERSSYTLEQFLDELVRPSRDLLAADVHKLRRRYRFTDGPAELTDLAAGGRSTRTAAVESEDASVVGRVISALGLGGTPNMSVPKGLKELLAFGGRRFAAIDVGTNSVKLYVAERLPAGGWRTVADRAEVTRLGEGLDGSGRLGEEPVRRTADAIESMVAEAREAGAEEIAAVGTAGLRKAENRDELLRLVQERCGVEVEVISGEEEARLAFAAAVGGLDLPPGDVVVFDTGGGSSQFTFGHDGRIDDQFSVEVGAARFTERFGLDRPVGEAELAEARSAIASELSFLEERPRPDALVGMGGAVTNIAAVAKSLAAYDPAAIQGTLLATSEIDRQVELYRTRTADERRQIVGLQPKRAEVILTGACIVRTVLAKLGRDALTVSDRGLRHGLLVERFGT